MKPVSILVALSVLVSTTATAATYTVRPDGAGDFPTIQAAIDAATDGDTIELVAGTFSGSGNRDLDYLGKAITVKSQSGDPETCIIQCDGSVSEYHRGFRFHTGEGPMSVLLGVTISDGYADEGGAIHCSAASPTISNCIVANCGADVGGGVRIIDSSPQFQNCRVSNNSGTFFGGGVAIFGSGSPQFVECVFTDNVAGLSGGGLYSASSVGIRDSGFWGNSASSDGGAVALGNGEEFVSTLNGCTIAGNHCDTYGVLYCNGGLAVVENCTLANNSGPIEVFVLTSTMQIVNTIIVDGWVECNVLGEVTLTCCDVYPLWGDCIESQLGSFGNISADPLFCDPDMGDYSLDATSPCSPEYNSECGGMGAWPVACGGATPTIRLSWGSLKNRFSR